MKKFLVILLALTMLSTAALAEGMAPQMFLGSRGLMVLDGNQLASMGGTAPDASVYGGLNIAGFSAAGEGQSAPAIFLVYNGVVYMAMDMTAMFGQPTLDTKGMSQVFIDLCEAYNFAVVTYSTPGDGGDFSFGDVAQLQALSPEGANADSLGEVYGTLEDFVAAVRAAVED